MITKKRVLPPRIEKEEALLRRLPKNHEKWREILRNFKKVRTGFKGEQELDYHLEFLPEDEYDILCDLRIPLDQRTFQMDTLVLSPHFALIIESKNIFGTLYFDEISKQVFRTFEGKKEGFPNPIQQVKRQRILFQRWLKLYFLKTIPVHYLVSIGLPSTINETNAQNTNLFDTILHAEYIPDKVLGLTKTHSDKSLTPYQQRKITALLLEQHSPTLSFDPLSFYKIHPSELLQGVPCPKCQHLPMEWQHGKWVCPSCHSISKDAHRAVLHDHLQLQHTLTNRECRALLGVNSVHLVKRLLNAMNLPHHGEGKKRMYFLER